MYHLIQNFSILNLIYWVLNALALMFALSIHEYAHGYVAYRLGDHTAKDMGRLTLNPFAHLDLLGGLLILVGAPILWAKPVPVNAAQMNNGRSIKSNTMKVALAGPLTNLVVSFISGLLLTFYIVVINKTHTAVHIGTPLYIISNLLELLMHINLNLAIFNLIPIPPLDGSKVLGVLLPSKMYMNMLRNQRYLGFIFIALILTGLLGRLLFVLRIPFIQLFNWVFLGILRLFGIG